MNTALVNFTSLKPWWIRAFILALIGHPLIASPVLHSQLHKDHFFKDLALWTSYMVFVWLFIEFCVGLRTFLNWITVASMFALTVLMTGAVFRKLGAWDWLQDIYHGSHVIDPQQNLMDLIFRFIMILASAPFALLVINSFPATDLMRWVSRRGASRTTTAALVGAIFLRMFQHVGEVVTRSMVAWREENPRIFVPRFSADWAGSIIEKIRMLEWVKVAIVTWCGAIAVQSIAAVPTVVMDFRRVQDGEKVRTGGGLR
jgi:hypothetical protein